MRTIFLKMTVLLTLFLFLGCDITPSRKACENYAEAVNLYMRGREEESLRLLKKLYGKYPRFTELTAFYGRVLFYSEKYRDAAECLEKSLQNDSESLNIDSIKLLVRCYLVLDRIADAEELLSGALKYSSQDPELLYLSACFHIKTDNMEQAFTLLKTAMSLRERQIEIPLKLAELYSSFGLYSEAASLIEQNLNTLNEDHPLRESMEVLNRSFMEKEKARLKTDGPSELYK